MGGISGFFPFQPGTQAFENSGEGPGYLPDITGGGSPEDPFTLNVPVVGTLPTAGGGTFGPIFSPNNLPSNRDIFGGSNMPISDFTQARGSILGSVIRAGFGALGNVVARSIPGAFLPQSCGADQTYDPVTGNCLPTFPMGVDVIANTTPGYSLACRKPRGMRAAAQCYVQTARGRRRGRYVMTSQGLTCCPVPRRMNPANARALNRAARRLKGFVKLEKRIHKALARACGPIGRRAARSYARARCGTCRKTKCVC